MPVGDLEETAVAAFRSALQPGEEFIWLGGCDRSCYLARQRKQALMGFGAASLFVSIMALIQCALGGIGIAATIYSVSVSVAIVLAVYFIAPRPSEGGYSFFYSITNSRVMIYTAYDGVFSIDRDAITKITPSLLEKERDFGHLNLHYKGVRLECIIGLSRVHSLLLGPNAAR